MANTDCKEQVSFGLFWPGVDADAPVNANRVTDEATGDTNETTALTMHPPLTGEDFNQATLTRNPENVRERLEVLRTEMEVRRYERDYCRAYLLESSGTLQWNGTVADGGSGKFVITADLYVRPFMAPNVCSIAQMSIDDGGGNLLYVETGTAPSVPGTSGDPPRAYSGANKISVEVLGSPGAVLGLVIDGDPADNVHITVDTTAVTGTNYAALKAFLNAQPAFSVTLGLYADLDVGCDPAAIVQPQDTLRLKGARDAEVHLLTPAGVAAFFAADAANCLADGDVLALWYDKTNDHPTTVGGKRQSIDTVGAENSANADGNLVNLTREPHKMYGAVPIARVVGTELELVSGERISRDYPILPGHAYVRRAGDSMTGQLAVTPTDTDKIAVYATGKGTEAGVYAVGGGTSGPGLSALGGAPNGNGVNATGDGAGYGVYATGGHGGGPGVHGIGGGNTGDGLSGIGGAASGRGVAAQGVGASPGVYSTGGGTSGAGVYGTGGTPNGVGVQGAGTGAGHGVVGTGGTTSGVGVYATGGAPDGDGVYGVGTGNGDGVSGHATSATGHGVLGSNTVDGGSAVHGTASNRARAVVCAGGVFRFPPLAAGALPSAPAEGDAYMDAGALKVYDGAGWKTATLT